MKTTITESGPVAMPAELRREMQLSAGQILIWQKVSPTECRVSVQADRKIIADPVAALGFAKEHGLETMPTDQWMKLLREGENE